MHEGQHLEPQASQSLVIDNPEKLVTYELRINSDNGEVQLYIIKRGYEDDSFVNADQETRKKLVNRRILLGYVDDQDELNPRLIIESPEYAPYDDEGSEALEFFASRLPSDLKTLKRQPLTRKIF